MAHFPPTYTDKESKILIAVYEQPHMEWTTYSLTDFLNPGISAMTPEYEKAFKETLKATEGLIVKSLIDGKQLHGGMGMYFSGMKLKFKGKQEAIKEHDRKAQFEKDLPEFLKDADAVVEELKKAQEKK